MRGYRRRSLLEGNVHLPVLAQPTIRASVSKNTTTGEIPDFTVPCELVLATEAGDVTVLLTTAVLADIVAEINAATVTVAQAQEADGTLVLSSLSAGDTAFIQVGRATSGLPDAAEMLGLPRDPDPLATVRGGDPMTTPFRPSLQANPEGASFLALGEDRSSAAFNRALSALARNNDTLYAQLNGAVARAVSVTVDAAWASRLMVNPDSSIEAVDLTDLDTMVAGLTGRLWVGGLTNASTLAEIAQYWRVTDHQGNELLAWDASASEPRRAVRVGAVTYGPRVGARPVFSDELSAPIPVLSNDATGFNALGNDVPRVGPTQITAIERGTLLRCASLTTGTGFVSNGVVVGDLVDVTASTINVPYNHNGTYVVELVLSENELLVRPLLGADVDALHSTDVAGDFGQVTVRSGGGWASHASTTGPGLYVTFDPPLPRFPSEGIRLSFGAEVALGALLDGDLLQPAGSGAPEASAFVVRQLWHRQSLDGVYQGMSGERAGGFFADVTDQPFTLRAAGPTTPSAGVLASGPYIGALADNVLTADPAQSFALEDVGRIFMLTLFGEPEELPCTVIEWIDHAHVVVVFPDGQTRSAASAVYNNYEFAVHTVGAGLHLLSPSSADGATVQTPGIVFTRDHQDGTTTDPVTPGTSLLHLERVTLLGDGAGAQTNRRVFALSSLTTGTPATVGVPFDPEATGNVFAEEGGDTRPAAGEGGRPSTLLHVLNGPNAGFYRVVGTTSSSGSGTNTLALRYMDGRDVTFVTFAATTYATLYNVHVGLGVPVVNSSTGSPRTAQVAVFFDATAAGEEDGTGLSIHWRGTGAGIRAALNDATFRAVTDGEGATGYLIDAELYAPAHGINLSVTGASAGTEAARSARGVTVRASGHQGDAITSLLNTQDGTTLSSWSAWVHQSGSDPALVLTSRLPAGTDAPVDAPDLYYPTGAALLLRTASPAIMGVGGAIDLTGSIYQRQVSAPFDGDYAGAIYTETGVGAGYWLHPLHPFSRNPNPSSLYAYDSALFPTELGSADQVYPQTTDAAAPIGVVQAPNATLFPFHHSGVLACDGDTALLSALGRVGTTRIIGKTLYLVDTVTFDGWYTIVGISTDGGATNLRIAVVAHDTTDVWAPTSPLSGEFRIYGKRWHQSHLSLADYALVGTWDTSAAFTDLPLISSHPDELKALRVGGVSWRTALIAPVSWSPVTDGTGIGTSADESSDMASVSVTPLEYSAAAEWSGPVYRHGWAAATDEPRSPFPNKGIFTNATDPSSSYATPGNPGGAFLLDDYAVEIASGAATARWSQVYGGSVELLASEDSTVRVLQRGRTYVLSAHLGVRVRVRISRNATQTVTYEIALRRADGSVVATRTATRTIGATLTDIEVELTHDALTRGAVDALGASQEPWPLHVSVDVPLTAASPLAYIMEIRSEPITRPLVVSGPQIVAGTQLAHGYRFTDPVRGFQTRGPADVRLLGGTDYARNESWDKFSAAPGNRAHVTGTQEQRGGTGLLRLYSEEIMETFAAAAAEEGRNAYIAYVATAFAGVTAVVDAITFPLSPMVLADVLSYRAALAAAEDLAGITAASVEVFDLMARCREIIVDTSGEVEAAAEALEEALGDARSAMASLESIDEAAASASAAVEAASLADHPNGWIRPWVDGHRLFTQGVHSAQITLYTPAFDPLWYAFMAHRLRANPADTVDVANFVLPGMTGFLIPLDPPHGAILTTLDLGLSFRAQNADHWGVYAEHPDTFDILSTPIPNNFGPISLMTLESKEDWDALAGVRVELWRYNAMDFDVSEDARAGWSEHEPEFGFGERIAEWTIDLSEVTPPSSSVNPVEDPEGWGTVYVGKEHFERRHWDISAGRTADAGRQVLTVDRRHYTYALVVRFYGGMRQEVAGGRYTPHGRVSGSSEGEGLWMLPQALTNEGRTFYMHKDGAYYGSGTNQDFGDDAAFPPAVKFRGARLGWMTDRAGNGGW